MELAACRRQQEISVAHSGSCVRSCVQLECSSFGAQCVNGTCICPTRNCPDTKDQVCATDHQTYENECEMMRYACFQRIRLTVLQFGECIEMSGSEGECDDDQCRFGGKCELTEGGDLRCICNFDCGAVKSLVCGSDGVIYGNECYMREASCKKQTDIIRAESLGHCEEDFEEDMCDGSDVLVNPKTKLEYNCASGKDVCPRDSYCHVINNTARCCNGTVGQATSNCQETEYGCCPDGTTIALGENHFGCSTGCRCHSLGSYSDECNLVTGQCRCKVGVGGARCDRCESNYWGMPKIKEGNDGCIPCECHINGSIRPDCEQMTGQCMCRNNVNGPKCNICADGSQITEFGCPGDDQDMERVPDNVLPNHAANFMLDKVTVKWPIQMKPVSLPSVLKYSPHISIDYTIPSFSGKSYIQLAKAKDDHSDLQIEIEFWPLESNGLLLYMGRTDDSRSDFMSLALRNGCVEFRFDLGGGHTILKTNQQVSLKNLHKVIATKHGKDGFLKVDNVSRASSVSPGALHSLDINTPVYLGYVPDLTEKISWNTGVNSGFVGCVKQLSIVSSKEHKQYELEKASSRDIEADYGISECDLESCKTVLCHNGGTCMNQTLDTYTCVCPSGFTGPLCKYEVADDV